MCGSWFFALSLSLHRSHTHTHLFSLPRCSLVCFPFSLCHSFFIRPQHLRSTFKLVGSQSASVFVRYSFLFHPFFSSSQLHTIFDKVIRSACCWFYERTTSSPFLPLASAQCNCIFTFREAKATLLNAHACTTFDGVCHSFGYNSHTHRDQLKENSLDDSLERMAKAKQTLHWFQWNLCMDAGDVLLRCERRAPSTKCRMSIVDCMHWHGARQHANKLEWKLCEWNFLCAKFHYLCTAEDVRSFFPPLARQKTSCEIAK